MMCRVLCLMCQLDDCFSNKQVYKGSGRQAAAVFCYLLQLNRLNDDNEGYHTTCINNDFTLHRVKPMG